MERTKGYTFSTKNKKTAILIVNKKRNRTYDIEVSVKKGKIEITNEYKYLGEWYNEKGDNSTSIQKKKEKITVYIRQIKFYGNEYILGKYTLLTRIKIYKTVIIPTIYHNIETWSKMSKKELNQLENIQGTILRAICEQRRTTPYMGLLAELGIWTIEKLIEYKKIMLIHNIMTSKEDRLIREIVIEQIQNTWKGCWIEQVKEICEKYNIDINEINKYTKSKLKDIIKAQINIDLNEELKNKQKSKTKLRFINDFSEKEYLKSLEYKESITMLKIRLNMIETKCNYKASYRNNLKCELCQEKNDTTEHLIECNILTSNKSRITINDINTPNNNIVHIIQQTIKERKKLGYKLTIDDDTPEMGDALGEEKV